MTRQLGIYGAGGFGREVAWLVSIPTESEAYHHVAYIDDKPGAPIRGVPVMTLEVFQREFRDAFTAIAVGNPAARERIAAKCGRFATLIAPSVEMSDSVEIGEGAIICAGSILTVDIKLGRHVHINLDCTIGHDVVMGDFATLAPGVHVSGNVHVGKGVYVGTGANIINGTSEKPLIIGDGAVIGAGACVTTDVEPRCLYAGVPAVLKKRY